MLGRTPTGCGTVNGCERSTIASLNLFDEPESDHSINMGRGRHIPFQKPKFHHTVKERMDYKPLNYEPRAKWDHHEVYV